MTEYQLHNSPRAAGLPCSSGLTVIASVPGYWTMISLEDWTLPSSWFCKGPPTSEVANQL